MDEGTLMGEASISIPAIMKMAEFLPKPSSCLQLWFLERLPGGEEGGGASMINSWDDVAGHYSAEFRIGSDFERSVVLSIRNGHSNAFSVSGIVRIRLPNGR